MIVDIKGIIKKFTVNQFDKVFISNRIRKVQWMLENGYLQVGKCTYGYNNLRIDMYQGSEAKVVIGKYCSIAKDVGVITGGIHPMDRVSTYPFRIQFNLKGKYKDGMPYTKGDIVIGNDVWIGTNVTILSGVKVGDGAVIATNSILSKDVPPYAVVGGNPARIIRYRFSQEVIDELLEIKWWDWSDEKVIESITQLSSKNIEEFINNHK